MPTPDKDHARVRAMIEKAAASVGGQNELARRMGYDKSEVSGWMAGRRPCPPKAQAVLAHLAGLDEVEVLVLATISQETDTDRKEVLLKALGKQLARLGGTVSCVLFAVLALVAPPAPAHSTDRGYDG